MKCAKQKHLGCKKCAKKCQEESATNSSDIKKCILKDKKIIGYFHNYDCLHHI